MISFYKSLLTRTGELTTPYTTGQLTRNRMTRYHYYMGRDSHVALSPLNSMLPIELGNYFFLYSLFLIHVLLTGIHHCLSSKGSPSLESNIFDHHRKNVLECSHQTAPQNQCSPSPGPWPPCPSWRRDIIGRPQTPGALASTCPPPNCQQSGSGTSGASAIQPISDANDRCAPCEMASL